MHQTFVFIDTCVLQQLKFDFTHEILTSFEKAGKEGHLILLLPEVTRKEIVSHMHESVDKAFAALNQNPVLLSTHMSIRDVELVKSEIDKRFQLFLGSLRTIELRISDKACRAALDNFLNEELPFEPGKTKEFKDAFTVNCLSEWFSSQEDDADLIVCSGDGGLSRALERISPRKIFKNVKEALSYVAKKHENYVALKDKVASLIPMSRGTIENLVREKLERVIFNFDHEYVDYYTEVKNITYPLKSLRLLSITDEDIYAECYLEVCYEVTASRSKKVWDSVDREFVSIGSEQYGPQDDTLEGNIKFWISSGDSVLKIESIVVEFETDEIELITDEDDWTYDRGDDDDDAE